MENLFLPESFSTSGDDEKFLESQLVSGVFSSIDNIEAGNRESIRSGVSSNVGIMLPERNSLRSSSGLGSSEGD
jgi:hypothetical protein